MVHFHLDDGESRALVRAEGAGVVLVQERRAFASSPEEADPRKRQLLEKHGLTPTDVFATTHVVRFTEALLEEGERATVLGLASWSSAPWRTAGRISSSRCASRPRESSR